MRREANPRLRAWGGRAAIGAVLAMAVAVISGASLPPAQEGGAEMSRLSAALDRLKELPLEGPSRGGPYFGLQANDVTNAVVAQGSSIVPLIAGRLAAANNEEAAWLVFCLRELRAVEAREAVEALRDAIASGQQYAGVDRTLTVDMQIAYFLRDVDSWVSP